MINSFCYAIIVVLKNESNGIYQKIIINLNTIKQTPN